MNADTEDHKVEKILVIDDDENIRRMLSKSLEADDYAVETALNGEEALDILETENFSLIMLDLKLPGRDGVEILEEIRERNINTPVLIITGFGSIESAVKVMKLGAIDYLEKPFNPEQIKAQVKDIIRRNARSYEDSDGEKIEDPDELLERAKSAINSRDFSRAEEFLNRAIKTEVEKAAAYNLLGALEEIKGNHTQAMKNYRTALDIEPSYGPAQKNLERAGKLGSKPDDVSLEEETDDKNDPDKGEDE